MEFYAKPNSALGILQEFQFPTGWNSTILTRITCCQNKLFQFPTGWNSTEIKSDRVETHLKFQFPTGWNSTINILSIKIRYGSFNSQRDGILHICPKAYNPLLAVSIPNGMEFYYEYAERYNLGIVMFQFPTGWNSTLWLYLKPLLMCRFNSQRDGILHSPRRKWRVDRGVSIPNGMEFYSSTTGKSGTTTNCFNSQRDGILPCQNNAPSSKRSCFNSQRDGILQHEFCHFSR